MQTNTLEDAMRRGCQVRAFMSGGGLRVVRVEDTSGTLVGYGEHPHIEEALSHAAEDLAAGGRPYHEVYGKLHTHYLTGESTASSDLDRWLLHGSKFRVRWDGETFRAELPHLGQFKTPDDAVAAAMAGRSTRTEHRGFVFMTEPSRFPNGERCASTRIVSAPPGKRGHEAWMWDAMKRGCGPTMLDALSSALAAEATEESDSDDD